MTQINLLPWREQLREERKHEFFLFLGITAVIALMIMFFIHAVVVQRTNGQQRRNAVLTREIKVLDEKVLEIKELKKTRLALIARMGIIQDLQENRPQVVHIFDDLVNILPKGIHFSEIARKNSVITLKGVAESNTNVSALMRNIAASKWLGKPILSQIKTDGAQGKQASEFSLQSLLQESKMIPKGQ